MKKRILLTLVTVMMVAMASAQETNERKNISLTEAERMTVTKNSGFAIRLFKEARKQNGSTDMILSPLSITYALGMLNNGATGETQQQINNVLGFGEAGAEGINALCRKLLTESKDLDKLTKVAIANTVFVNSGLGCVLKPDFIKKANDYYDASPENRDFFDGVTRDVINQWAADHTEQMIKEILTKDEFNTLALSYLLNAIYFKGTWAYEFDKAQTKEEPFDGGDILPMMHQEGVFTYSDQGSYQEVWLPYGNGAFEMVVMLPSKDKTIDDVLSDLEHYLNGDYGRTADDNIPHLVDLKLPRIETETSVRLDKIMSDLGMPRAFNPKTAEFGEFCYLPEGSNAYIGLMKQVAKIKLDEEGTEAAAVTIIGMEATSIPSEPKQAVFHANRPFLYLIREKSTGVIFFIGQYMGKGVTATLASPRNTNVSNSCLYNLQGCKAEYPQRGRIYIRDGRKFVVK